LQREKGKLSVIHVEGYVHEQHIPSSEADNFLIKRNPPLDPLLSERAFHGSYSCDTVKYGHESCGTRTKNECAGEDQQQFTIPGKTLS
jgi:hypothetical protein